MDILRISGREFPRSNPVEGLFFAPVVELSKPSSMSPISLALDSRFEQVDCEGWITWALTKYYYQHLPAPKKAALPTTEPNEPKYI